MATLQSLLQGLDETSSLALWAVTSTKHQYYFDSVGSQKFLKEDTNTAQIDSELFQCLTTDTSQIIKAIETYLSKTRPVIYELG